jgi:hypothetical protein
MSIKAIHTPCKNCVFAKYDGKTQTDCHLDMTTKFSSKGIEIIKAYDEEKEFDIINGKKCYGYRENKYFVSRGLEEADIEEKINYVKQFFKINYLMIINIKNFDYDTMYSLAQEIKSLAIKPQNVVLIRYQEDKSKYDYSFLHNFFNRCGNLDKWKIQTVIDSNESQESIIYKIINTNKSNRFVMYINEDFYGFDKVIKRAQETIYQDFSTFEILSNKNKDSLFFNSSVYSYAIYYGYNILQSKDKYEIVQ